jgi:hypothetical protein
MLAIMETLEAGNAPAAVAVARSARTDQVVKCIYRALWSRLAVIVTRAYADVRSGDRHAQHAFDLLKDPVVRTELETMGSDLSALDEAVALWAECRGDPRRRALHDFRDKQVAHWAIQKRPSPVINNLFAVTRATATALERLAQRTRVVTLTVESQLVDYKDAANRFWGAP